MVGRFVSCRASGILCLVRRVIREEWHLCPTGRVIFMSYGTSDVYVLRDESNGTSPTGRVTFTLSKPVCTNGGDSSETDCDRRGF